MKQVLSGFIDAKHKFFDKHANAIRNKVKNEDVFIQEVFDILQHMNPCNELEIPAFEYLANLLITTNRSQKYEHLLGRAHMFMDLLMNHLEITKKAPSQAALEERENIIKKMDRNLQASFKKLYELNAAGLDIYDAVKEYPPFIQKLLLLSYIASQPNLSAGDTLSNIYSTSRELTRYQELVTQLSLEKIIRNTLFAGVYNQSISELCASYNAQTKKPTTEEKIRTIFQTFIKSYTDPTVIFSQIRKIQEDWTKIMQKNKKMNHYSPKEIFFHARVFYCSHMINSELIRESFLIYRDQTQQQNKEEIKLTVTGVNSELADETTTSKEITQEQATIAEEITQRITNTYGCFQNYIVIYKYLCRVISNKGIIASRGLAKKLQEIGISCREQTINHYLKTIQKTANQNNITINLSSPQRKLTGIASEQIQEALQHNSKNEVPDRYKPIQTIGEIIDLFAKFGIQLSPERKIDNLIQEHIINKGNHKRIDMILHIRSQLHSNSISASQVKIVSLKKNKYKTIAFNDGTRIIIRENTILDICNHNDYENKRIPKFQQ